MSWLQIMMLHIMCTVQPILVCLDAHNLSNSKAQKHQDRDIRIVHDSFTTEGS
jgi:hypothetical protein